MAGDVVLAVAVIVAVEAVAVVIFVVVDVVCNCYCFGVFVVDVFGYFMISYICILSKPFLRTLK